MSSGEHAHHWEVSWAPLVATVGILFLVPLSFSTYFVYGNPLLSYIFMGVGTPLLLAGIAKWVAEGHTQKPLIAGLSPSALPIFIISEVFIFLGLFTAYWTMRLSADTWPPAGTPAHMNLVLPLIMTVILVTSSITYHVAEAKFDAGNKGGFKFWLFLSILLGAIFLGCTLYEYSHLIHQNFVPSTNAYSTAFFSITGFHASHVLVGLGIFLAVLFAALAGKTNKYFIFSAGVYWHFVDVVWFFVVTQIYYW
ncbi:MAG: heme-copper oxidase subunit III [Magnetococcales bacterium]|nr:heme-copper oxidase subunit III [Magnetococcales bacterium]MBF0156556.1 heme-copper oxidase subunit III [Magnetococcales bacterium]